MRLNCVRILAVFLLAFQPMGWMAAAQPQSPQLLQVTAATAAIEATETVLMPLVARRYTPGFGFVTGTVVDASNKNPLVNAEICFEYTNCVLTDSLGQYLIGGIPSGGQYLTGYKEGYNEVMQGIFVVTNYTVTMNVALAPVSNSVVEYRVVLSWDPITHWPPTGIENDLDVHFWLDIPNPPTHISLDNRGDCEYTNSFPNACLEADVRQGSGPETVGIEDLEPAIYYYGVLNYNQGQPGVPPVTQVGAQVRLYDANGLAHTFLPPATGQGDMWLVFIWNGVTRVMTTVNCITTFPSEGTLPSCPP
jgi:hypothetical protein